MNIRETMQEWNKGIRISQIANLRAATYYDTRNRKLDLLVIISSVVVGTSIFSILALSQDPRVLFVVGIISIIAAVLSGVSTSLNYPQVAEKHLRAGRKYGELRRRVDEFLCLKSDSELEQILDQILMEWDMLDAESPDVPQRFIEEAENVITTSR
jgi:hypothetical protein